jgi:NAD(P)-dependent dehydrogenase (short-subunit alcohol dehydrogenase family)
MRAAWLTLTDECPGRSSSGREYSLEDACPEGDAMLLEGKNAVIYGGGGDIGGAVARAFAREGATVHLAGRTLAKLEKVAEDVRQQGGTATVAQVDALDESAVDAHADDVVRDHGTLDISMNLISTGDVQGTPLVEMKLADFEAPIHNAMRSTYVTARAAGRHMIRQGSGVILMFGGEGDPIRDYNIGGFQISLTAVEALRKQLASELGRHGIRVVSLLTGGVIDSIPPDFEGRDALVKSLVAPTLLGRGALLEDVGNVAAFAASDQARTITASAINITCGAIIT